MKSQEEIDQRHRRNGWYSGNGWRESLRHFPRPGARLRFLGVRQAFHTDVMKNAEEHLRVGEVYTLQTIELFSSWACVTLNETGAAEYCLSFFENLDLSESQSTGR